MARKLSKTGFVVLSPSFSSSPVSLAELNFLMMRIPVWMSPNLTPLTKISFDVTVDRPGSRKSRLVSGTHNGHLDRSSWTQC